MILNSVHLHNFMSYADSTLDLNGIAVACLTGLNGAGKSAILDAVTWAIWEEARGSSDELVRLGEKEMWVEIVFSHEGQLYRVRRSRQKQVGKAGGKGTSKGTLEFQIADQTGDLRWNSLTAASMKETGKHICDLLRMDYDTFINSAYLKQGRAEEFTTRLPSERKQVLAEILGLSYFDRLQEEARERLRGVKAQIEFLEGSLAGARQVEAEFAQVHTELCASQIEYDDLVLVARDIEQQVEEVTAQLQQFKLIEVTISSNEKQLVELNHALKRIDDQKLSIEQKKKSLGELIGESSDIEAQLTEFNQVRAAVEKLDSVFLEVQDLSDKKLELTGQLATLRSRLEVKLEGLEVENRELVKSRERLLRDTEDSEKIKSQYLEFRQLLESEAVLSQKQEAHSQLANRVSELTSTIQEAKIRLEAELGQKQGAIKELAALTQSQASLVAEGAELDQLKERLERLEAEFELVEKTGIAIKSDLESLAIKAEEIRGRQRENLEKIKELKEHEHSSICPLCSAPIVDRAAVIERYLKHNEEMDLEINQLDVQKEKLNDQRAELRVRYVEMRKELEGRKDLDKRIGQYNERQQALLRASDSEQKLNLAEAQLAEKLAQNNFAQVERESLVAVKAELHKLEFDPAVYVSLQSQIRLKRHIEGKHQQLAKDTEELAKVNAKIPELKKAIEEIASELSGELYGQAIRLELKEVLQKLTTFSYDRNEHARLKQRLSELFVATEKSRDLSRAMAELPALDEQLGVLQGEYLTKQAQIAKVDSEQVQLKSQLKDLDLVEKTLAGLKPSLDEVRGFKEESGRKVAVLSSRSHALSDELTRLAARLQEMTLLREEMDDYAYLVEVFGKKGIQAVIIENAIPEIENEANRILSRLTDNKMHIALITQTKTKSGTMAETLDLVIGDEVGTRSYELYSGGEAFKVNFALRIALSRLLARRAGAKLETLIIDEGFGSQDDGSRERLVKAIRLIQADFSRVLVITHIADVREMFPVQIQVTKSNGISTFKLVS
jgi:exonuclease SbcC